MGTGFPGRRRTEPAQDYATTVEGAGFITRGGRLVTSWGDETTLYDLKSSSKSIGFTAMGLAILDGKLSLSDRAVDCHPQFGVPPAENQSNPWRGRIKLLHLATHTAGFEKPGGYTKLFFEPGTKWAYSDGGPNWLAECLTLTYRKDIQELLFERVFNHLGIGRDDLRWRTNQYRAAQIDGIERREFGSGVHANVDAMARIGYLYLRGGEWDGRQLLPSAFVKQVARPPDLLGSVSNADEEHYPQAPAHYGLRRRNPGQRPSRRLLVLGLTRQSDRRHPELRYRHLTRRPRLARWLGRRLRTARAFPEFDRRRGNHAATVPAQPRHNRHRVGAGIHYP